MKKPGTYSLKRSETRQKMDPVARRAAIRAYKYLHAMVRHTVHSSRVFMRPPKNRQHVAKVLKMHPSTDPANKNFPRSHPNSRPNCYTACRPCQTHGRLPKSQSTWTPQANGYQKWEVFADEYVRHQVNPQATPQPPEVQNALRAVENVLVDLENRVIEFFNG